MFYLKTLQNPELFVFGDFNIHLDNTNKLETREYLNLLSLYGLTSQIAVPTHTGGHTLDSILMKMDTAYNVHFRIREEYRIIFFIGGILDIPKPRPVKKTISYRKLKDVNIESLNSGISNAFNKVDDPTTATLLYNETMENCWINMPLCSQNSPPKY